MLKKRYKIIVIIFISLFIFTACDNSEESIIKDQKYLSIALNNDYSVNNLKPGEGRFSYDKNSVAEISFDLNEGYEFDGGEGEAESRLAPPPAEGNTTYQLKMTEDSQLVLKTILNKFKLLTVGLADIREVDYNEGIKISNLLS